MAAKHSIDCKSQEIKIQGKQLGKKMRRRESDKRCGGRCYKSLWWQPWKKQTALCELSATDVSDHPTGDKKKNHTETQTVLQKKSLVLLEI